MHGANANSKTSDGWTPLHWAVREELPSVEDLQEVVLKLRVGVEDPDDQGLE